MRSTDTREALESRGFSSAWLLFYGAAALFWLFRGKEASFRELHNASNTGMRAPSLGSAARRRLHSA